MAIVMVRGDQVQSHTRIGRGQQGPVLSASSRASVLLAVAAASSLRAPVQPCPAPASYMKRADSSPGTEPSTVSANASRPWASPLHIPDQAGEALSAGFLASSGGGRDVLMGLPRQSF